MFFLPGWLVSAATFPGVIIHEAAHFFFCRKYRLAVFDVCFFQFDNPAGYVLHESTNDFKATFMVSMGPFFINTALCIVFCSAAFIPVGALKVFDPYAYFFYWLGISIGMHAFPSVVDLKHIWKLAPAEARKGNPLAIVSYPIVAILVVLNYARALWADLGYGIAVGILVPLAIFKAMV